MNFTLLVAQTLIYLGAGLAVLFTLLGLGMVLGIVPGRITMKDLHLHDTYYIILPFWLYFVPVVGAGLILGSGIFMKRAYEEGAAAIEELVSQESSPDA